MNALFKCNFQVMDHVHGHSQTTKGIWLGRDGYSREDPSQPPCLVVDVEGIDSRERGEDRQTFEHRSALFALALADCLCINLWYHSLGNFTASGYGLLKTVMQVNLELFAQEKKSVFPGTPLLDPRSRSSALPRPHPLHKEKPPRNGSPTRLFSFSFCLPVLPHMSPLASVSLPLSLSLSR